MPGPLGWCPRSGVACAVCSPRCSSCACSPPPRGRTGFPPRRSTAPAPTSSAVGNVDLARDGAGAVGVPAQGRRRHARVRLAPVRRRLAARPSAWTRRRARSPRCRSRPATATGSPWPGSPTASCTRTSRRAARRSPARSRRHDAARRPEREVDRHRPGRQRRGLRHLAAGRQRPRRAPAGQHLDDASPAPLDVDPALEAGTGALRPRVAGQRRGLRRRHVGRRGRRRATRACGRAGSPGSRSPSFPQDC